MLLLLLLVEVEVLLLLLLLLPKAQGCPPGPNRRRALQFASS